jgi:hypothetical protein
MQENEEVLNHIIVALIVIFLFLLGALYLREEKKPDIEFIFPNQTVKNIDILSIF